MADTTYQFTDPIRRTMLDVLARMEGGGNFLGPKRWPYDGPPLSKPAYDRLTDKERPKLFSGYTLGKLQGDAAAGNPHARDAFYDVMGDALAAGKMRPERYEEIMSGIGYMATSRNPIDRHRAFIDSLLQSSDGEARVAQMDDAILQDDQNKVGELEQAFEKRWRRALDPASLAMLAGWANKFGDLKQTEQVLTGRREGTVVGTLNHAPRLGEILDYLSGQKFFRASEGDKKSGSKSGGPARYRNHLEALAQGIAESVSAGELPAQQLLSADVQELNRRLLESGSRVRLDVPGSRSVGIQNDRNVDGIPDDWEIDHAGFVSPLVRKKAERDMPDLRKLASLDAADFDAATRGAKWERLWR
ncbi:MAG TPA: hypothetical protein PLR41_03830 [Alphaproteobacteria bacterium]|nr:hypothetical protein [Alphaproteobacteria bacterium]